MNCLSRAMLILLCLRSAIIHNARAFLALLVPPTMDILRISVSSLRQMDVHVAKLIKLNMKNGNFDDREGAKLSLPA